MITRFEETKRYNQKYYLVVTFSLFGIPLFRNWIEK